MVGNTFLEMRNITKTFPGVVALESVDFTCRSGEIHAVAGQNGAGKSTLMKIIAGVYQPDSGEVFIQGRPVQIQSTHYAQQLGIGIIHQEFNLLADFSIAENVFLGREPRHFPGLLNRRELEARASDVLARLGVNLDPHMKVGQLSVAQKQMVEIAKTLALNARLVIMDEPSATLGGQDLERVFETIVALKQQGVAIIYISHRLEEIFEIADYVTVFRDGRAVGSKPTQNITRGELITLMVGRELTEAFPQAGTDFGEEILTVTDLSVNGLLTNINLSVRHGEIVGISGLMGSGRTELAQAIFGERPYQRGSICINGQTVRLRSPRDAMRLGIGYLPESRKDEGIIAGLSVQQNASLPSLRQRQRFGFVRQRADRAVVHEHVEKLSIRTPTLHQEIQYLSGGNQQKVVLSKWLITGSKLLIFDEPTRGIDVGAKAEIWHLMRELANRGHGILMISSELPEIMGMSDRIVVMYKGRVAGTLSRAEATPEAVMAYATYGEEAQHDHNSSHLA